MRITLLSSSRARQLVILLNGTFSLGFKAKNDAICHVMVRHPLYHAHEY